MVKMAELKVLAKTVMAASVDAQLSGLTQVSICLGMAFEEIVREAEGVRAREAGEEAERLSEGGGEVVDGG